MKYLILGANGMAGHTIAAYLSEKGHMVTGFARQESPICKTVTGDALNKCDIERTLQTDSFDYVINCIGVLNKCVDENMADGIYINSVLPHYLAAKVDGTKTKLIHISTDCVFEGTKGGYAEKDQPDALSYYGRSKALGEVIDKKNLTIRTSIIGPELKTDGIGLFHWFMSQKQSVHGYEKVIWSGVTTLQLAKAIEADPINRQTGICHLVNNQTISKHDLLLLFNNYCRTDKLEVKSDVHLVSDKSLISTARQEMYQVPSYEQMVKEMDMWIKGHPGLYGQYL